MWMMMETVRMEEKSQLRLWKSAVISLAGSSEPLEPYAWLGDGGITDSLAHSMLLASGSDRGTVWGAGLICWEDAEVHRTECCNGRADRTDRWQMWRTLSSGDSVWVSGMAR